MRLEAGRARLALDGRSMEKIDLLSFYRLGTALRPLCEVTPEMGRLEIFIRCSTAKGQLESLLGSWPGLTVCRKDGLTVIQAVAEWVDTASAGEWKKPMDWMDEVNIRSIANKAKAFETVLRAELQTLATYHVTQKGIYSTPDLIERADNTLPGSIRRRIPRKAREEIRESGKCLAFDNATASGFHMMRATEMVLHQYYLAVCEPKKKAKLGSWAAYLGELRESGDPDAQKVVAMLQQIKDQDRNLIMHPEIVLSSDDAFTLFEVGQSAIIAMAGKLEPTRKRKPDEEKAGQGAEAAAEAGGKS